MENGGLCQILFSLQFDIIFSILDNILLPGFTTHLSFQHWDYERAGKETVRVHYIMYDHNKEGDVRRWNCHRRPKVDKKTYLCAGGGRSGVFFFS